MKEYRAASKFLVKVCPKLNTVSYILHISCMLVLNEVL